MVENKKRGRGRPRSFEENAALDKAIAVFWAKGFAATSVDDLAEAMGIGRPSMYGAFGDKEAIFMRCLERYAETVAFAPLDAFGTAGTIEDAISAYLRGVAEYATHGEVPRGCMMGAVAGSVDDPKVREFVAGKISGAEEFIADRLQAAVAAGELPGDFPVRRRARRTINAMLAIATRARHGVPFSELLEDVADGTAAVVLLPGHKYPG